MITSIPTDLKPGREDHRLRSLIDEGQRRARRLGVPVLVSVIRPIPACDPLACFGQSATFARDRLFWARPNDGYTTAGIGAAWTLTLKGPHRFADAAVAWRDLCATALVDSGPGVADGGPLLFGGFGFDPLRAPTPLWDEYPDGLLLLPRYTITRTGDSCWLTTNIVLRPGAPPAVMPNGLPPALRTILAGDPAPRASAPNHTPLELRDVLPAETWKEIVRSSIAHMHATGMEKVVLARECRANAARPFDPAQVLGHLRDEYPGCFVFAVARGAGCFLGATPERLVDLRQGMVRTICLAGTIARGATPEEDLALGEALLASAKERTEHAIVVRGLRDALAGICDQLAVPDIPTLLKVRNVQHLFTPVTGQVKPGCTVLDLVERLHPTPAMGGLPRAEALALIRERERLDRGWYAAPVGWMDMHGDGEFAVAIRSGLLRGAEAALFAGCGIVADSDPDREYAETRLKLRPMLSALGSENQEPRTDLEKGEFEGAAPQKEDGT